MSVRNFSPLLVLAALAFQFVSDLHAGASNKSGNPFGNGTFFQNTATFSAVIRGQNLSGTMLFSTGVNTNAGSTNTSGGSCVISYLGSSDGLTAPGLYNGNSSGMWDPSSGSISGQFWGSQLLSGTNRTTIYPEIYNTNNFPVPINTVSNTMLTFQTTDPLTGVTTTTTTNLQVTNTLYVEPVGFNSFRDSVMMNGSFDGYTQNKYPNQTFSAQGMIAQQQLYPQQQTDPNAPAGTVPVQMAAPLYIPVSVQGVRISDSYSSFSAVSNSVPYSMTTYTITNFSGF